MKNNLEEIFNYKANWTVQDHGRNILARAQEYLKTEHYK